MCAFCGAKYVFVHISENIFWIIPTFLVHVDWDHISTDYKLQGRRLPGQMPGPLGKSEIQGRLSPQWLGRLPSNLICKQFRLTLPDLVRTVNSSLYLNAIFVTPGTQHGSAHILDMACQNCMKFSDIPMTMLDCRDPFSATLADIFNDPEIYQVPRTILGHI